jgi:hypothetical protein
VRDNALFYGGALTARRYHAWLETNAVRYVAVAHAALDLSADREVAMIDRGLRYLRLVWRSPRFSVYAVAAANPLASGPAVLTAYGADSLTLRARAPGRVLLRVRFTPYWALSGGAGCVAPAGDFTAVDLRRAGTVRLVIAFSLARVGGRAPRCTEARSGSP